MKKLFVIAFLFVFALSVNAQRSGSTTTFLPNEQTKTLTMTAADTITQGGTAYWTFAINKPYCSYWAFSIAIDTLTHGTNRLATTVWGSMDGTNFVNTGATQVNVFPTAGGGADTTYQMVDVSTGVLWKYLRVKFVSVDANLIGSKVKGISLKVVNKR